MHAEVICSRDIFVVGIRDQTHPVVMAMAFFFLSCLVAIEMYCLYDVGKLLLWLLLLPSALALLASLVLGLLLKIVSDASDNDMRIVLYWLWARYDSAASESTALPL